MRSGTAFTLDEDVQRMRDEIFLLRLEHAVLVEGKSDEPFWKHLWDKILPGRYKIYAYVHFPTTNTSGKTALVHYFLPYASRDLLICLDSDYDYLLEIPFLSQPFILHTYVHSIENFQCYEPALLEVLRIGTGNETAYFDFETFFEKYNRFAYCWLTLHIYQYQTTGAPIRDTADFVTMVSNLEETFVNLEAIPAFQDLLQRLASLGLNEQNAYLFVPGHDLKRIILSIIKTVAEPIIRQEFAQRTPEQRAVYQQYQRQHTFEALLGSHHRFEECDFYVRLFSDAVITLG